MDKASAYGAADCRYEGDRGHHAAEGSGALQTEELSRLALPATAATVMHSAGWGIDWFQKPFCRWETTVSKDDQHTSHGLMGGRRAVDLAAPGSSPGGCISTGAATACVRGGGERRQHVGWRASWVKFTLLGVCALSVLESKAPRPNG